MVTTEEERAFLKVSVTERKGYSAFFKLVALATIKYPVEFRKFHVLFKSVPVEAIIEFCNRF